MASLITVLLVGIPLALLVRVLFGFTMKRVMSDKCYKKDWFWPGFAFGALALLFSLSKPDLRPRQNRPPPADTDVSEFFTGGGRGIFH